MFFFNSNDIIMQKKFKDWIRPIQLKQISAISFLTGLLYLLFAFVDYLISPENLLPLMYLVHIIVMPSILFAISILAYLKRNYTFMVLLLFIAPIVASTGNIIIVSYLNDYPIYSSEIYAILFWTFTIPGLRIIHSLSSAIIIIIISTLSAYSIHKLQFNVFVLHTFWMTVSLSLGLLAKFLFELSNKTTFMKQEELSRELNNRDILLRELFHRVKNNLQIISSLLSMQSKKVNDKSAKETFQNSIQTIKSMSLIHEKLYKSDNLEVIDFNDYISSLIEYMKQNLQVNDIKFNIGCDEMMVTLDKAVPIGLIINEVLTNSIKYAFDKSKEKKLININMYNDDKKLVLKISDNGKGINFHELKKGFGFKLIDSLVKHQLKGEIDYYNDNGLYYVFKFKG